MNKQMEPGSPEHITAVIKEHFDRAAFETFHAVMSAEGAGEKSIGIALTAAKKYATACIDAFADAYFEIESKTHEALDSL